MKRILTIILALVLCVGITVPSPVFAAGSAEVGNIKEFAASFTPVFDADGFSMTVTALTETAGHALTKNYLVRMFYDRSGRYLASRFDQIIFDQDLKFHAGPMPVSAQAETAKYVIWESLNSIRPVNKVTKLEIPASAVKADRVKGRVVQNSVTGLQVPRTINTAAMEQICLKITDNGGSDQFQSDQEYVIGSAGTGAERLVGLNVTAEVWANADGSFTLLSIEEDVAKNRTVEFELAQFDSLSESEETLYYRAEDGSRAEIPLVPQTEILYNNIAFESVDQLFGPQGILQKYPFCSGIVKAVDTDADLVYDTLFVELIACGIVGSIDENGTLTFKNTVGAHSLMNYVPRVEFETSSTNMLIHLTKDGKPYDYHKVKEGDCLSIVTNTDNKDSFGTYIEARLTNDIREGTITEVWDSDTSSTGNRYIIQTEQGEAECDAVEEIYCDPGYPSLGQYGTFYLDEYGKMIAAFVNDSASSSFMYLVDACVQDDQWGGREIIFNFLRDDGKLYQCSSDAVSIENAGDYPELWRCFEEMYPYDPSYYENIIFIPRDWEFSVAEQIAEALPRTLTKVKLANDDFVDTIRLPGGSGEFELIYTSREEKLYSQSTQTIDQIELSGEASVFFITSAEGNVLAGSPVTPERCMVGKITDLNDGQRYAYAAYNSDEFGQASALVVYNIDTGLHDVNVEPTVRPAPPELTQIPVYIAGTAAREDEDQFSLVIPDQKEDIYGLADRVLIHNAASNPDISQQLAIQSDGSAVYQREQFDTKTRLSMMSAMQGQAAICTSDSFGKITEVTLAATAGTHSGLDLLSSGTGDFVEDTMTMNGHPITDHTLVFYIRGFWNQEVNLYEEARAISCFVSSGNLVAGGSYLHASYDTNGDGTVDILALFNTGVGVKKDAPEIEILKTGKKLYRDIYKSYAVKFMQDGELVTARIDDFCALQPEIGKTYRFGISNGWIYSYQECNGNI